MTDVAVKPVAATSDTEGMAYLVTRSRKLVTVYLPLSLLVFVLLFPFYWMGSTISGNIIRSGSPARRFPTSTSCCSTPNIRSGCSTP